MTMFTSAIPVWLNITCGECSHHQDFQMGEDMTLMSEDNFDWECSECGSTEIAKINIDGSSNADMRTLDEVRDN